MKHKLLFDKVLKFLKCDDFLKYGLFDQVCETVNISFPERENKALKEDYDRSMAEIKTELTALKESLCDDEVNSLRSEVSFELIFRSVMSD